jgi:NAD-dependent dihydropyrimidine dehydrogenase PreA subunit
MSANPKKGESSMDESVFYKLAKVLDTLPNGFPATESGIEIEILKKIFRPEDAELFCDLRLTLETAEQIAKRTGRPPEGLEEKLLQMKQRGQIFSVELGNVKLFRMFPWIFGIYEFQLPFMTRELAQMCEKYQTTWGRMFVEGGVPFMQVVPVEKEIPVKQEALTYEKVSSVIENGKAFLLNECICKKEKMLLGHPCTKPLEVCLAIAPLPGFFDKSPTGRVISKAEAYEVLRKSEEAGLVHMTSNFQSGNFFICNCCGCCCGPLQAINKLGASPSSSVNSYYFARIDPDQCVACGICAEERCQVKAIREAEGTYQVEKDRCIGCGLCISTCPSGAIRLVRKQPEEQIFPPKDEMAWYEERARRRGVDFSRYK